MDAWGLFVFVGRDDPGAPNRDYGLPQRLKALRNDYILYFMPIVGAGVPDVPNVGNGLDRSEKIHLLLRFSF